MSTQQTQDMCVYESENVTIDFTAYDSANVLLDLTGATVRFVAWTPPDGAAVITKVSSTPSEILIDPDQVANTGQAQIFLLPADLVNSAVLKYNVWVDTAGGDQLLMTIPSRFEILIAKRS